MTKILDRSTWYGIKPASDEPRGKVTVFPLASMTNVPPPSFQHASNVAYVVEEARNNEVSIVRGCDSFSKGTPIEDLASRLSDEQPMLDIVVEGVTLPKAFQSYSGDPVEPLSNFGVGPPEQASEIVAQ
jgi:hypothetical protein